MCGVCGMVESDGRRADPGTLQRMMTAMVHRGPDDAGQWLHGATGLGFRRLSIVDLAGGHQPMTGEDGRVASVVNGELYNHQTLRRELMSLGHRFTSDSDAEVVPHLFEQWGIDGVARLRGMFAIALADVAHDTVYLVRDHFGIKPLYYAEADGALLFASEIRSLLASGRVNRVLDPQALWHYFTFQYVPDPYTMFRPIRRLPPAHYLQWHQGRLSLHRYWQLAFRPDRRQSAADAARRVHDALKDSVARHMMSDVPRGAYLSSGIDSSLVAAFMRAREPIKTFSIGFSGPHHQTNELLDARATAAALGTDHHEVVVSAQEYREELPRIVAAQEEPLGDPSAPALYFLARAARQHVTVVLSGEGADELFGGYPIYREPLALAPFAGLPPWTRALMARSAALMPPGMKGRGYLERGALPLERRFIGNAKMFTEAEKRDLLAGLDDSAWDEPYRITDPLYAVTDGLDAVARMQTVDCHTWLPGDILMKADKMSMAHSLELRVPFLDVDVFEEAARLPRAFRVGHGTTKWLLRQAAVGILPPAVINRPKLGFPIPVRDWIAGELRDFVLDVVRTVRPPMLDSAYVERLVNDTGFVWNHHRKVWTCLAFLLWYQAYVEPGAAGLVAARPARQQVSS